MESKRAVSLFTAMGLQQQWALRIQTLLSIPVGSMDGLKCKLRVVSLEKATVDLREFKQLASCSMSALAGVQCPVKKSKCTSSDTGVSPATAKDRPRSKLSGKRLDSDSKVQKVLEHEKSLTINIFIGPLRTGATAFQIQSSSHSDEQLLMMAASPDSLMTVSSSG